MVSPQVIVMKLRYPVSANLYWRHRTIKSAKTKQFMTMTYPSPEAEAYKEEVKWVAGQYGVKEPIRGRVKLTVDLYPHLPLDWKKRQRNDPEWWDDTVKCQDLDNLLKVTLDSFNGVVITDDSMLREINLRRMVPDGEARMIVTITPIPRSVSPQLAMQLDIAPTALAKPFTYGE